jgi:glycosyltransferase involved in cell wall biosynthesis
MPIHQTARTTLPPSGAPGSAPIAPATDAPAEPQLSVIVPVCNEVDSISVVWYELDDVLRAGGWRVEIIIVDDGSTDGTFELLRTMTRDDPRVRLVRFAHNAGLTAALLAGLRRARGAFVVTMDSDLQSDPRDIGRLVAALADADAAVGWRQTRRDPWLKRLSSRIGNRVRSAVTGDDFHDNACTLRAMRRECVAAIPEFDGVHRFIPTFLALAGYRVAEVVVHHRNRLFGRSKYGVRNRLGRTFRDLLMVHWLAARAVRFEVAEDLVAGATSEAGDQPPRRSTRRPQP